MYVSVGKYEYLRRNVQHWLTMFVRLAVCKRLVIGV